MNRYPMGKPPRWWSPKPSRFWMTLWHPVRRYHQIWKERISRIEVRGLEHVRGAIAEGHGVLITANHPGHADCFLLWEALCRLRRPCYVMTTWQVFQMASKLERLQFRQHGCFSVDRDGADRQAFSFSVDVLAGSSNPLVIFPEGEVYHLNERVTPFREGPAAIAMAAVRRSGRPVSCIPCALKYEYTRDPTPQLRQVMDQLEARLGVSPRSDRPLADRLYYFAEDVLDQQDCKYFGAAQPGNLSQRIERLTLHILQAVDERYGVKTVGIAPERIKRLRQAAIARREALPPGDARREEIERDLEELFLALKLFSYPADYIAENPTIERVAETIDKLEEDLLDKPTAGIRGRRRGIITFGPAVVIEASGDRDEAREVTTRLRDEVQRLLYIRQPEKEDQASEVGAV